KNKKLKYVREADIKIYYKAEYIALRKVDFLIDEKITVELKAKSEMDDAHLAQAINYPEASHCPIALLINFGAKSLQFKRLFNKKIPHNQIQSYES
ncbi:MAG TPA: GxxExxY protein, partial [Flavisolibacter sp.]